MVNLEDYGSDYISEKASGIILWSNWNHFMVEEIHFMVEPTPPQLDSSTVKNIIRKISIMRNALW